MSDCSFILPPHELSEFKAMHNAAPDDLALKRRVPDGGHGSYCECPDCWANLEQIAAALPNSPAAIRVELRKQTGYCWDGGC